jgi:23S rRNA G2445 N2-methylase RlmL
VSEDIRFSVSDYLQPSNSPTLIVTNPPYGNRLESDNLDEIYKKLIMQVQETGGGFITTYPVDVRFGLANKKLLNGSEECRYWYKK